MCLCMCVHMCPYMYTCTRVGVHAPISVYAEDREGIQVSSSVALQIFLEKQDFH